MLLLESIHFVWCIIWCDFSEIFSFEICLNNLSVFWFWISIDEIWSITVKTKNTYPLRTAHLSNTTIDFKFGTETKYFWKNKFKRLVKTKHRLWTKPTFSKSITFFLVGFSSRIYISLPNHKFTIFGLFYRVFWWRNRSQRQRSDCDLWIWQKAKYPWQVLDQNCEEKESIGCSIARWIRDCCFATCHQGCPWK